MQRLVFLCDAILLVLIKKKKKKKKKSLFIQSQQLFSACFLAVLTFW